MCGKRLRGRGRKNGEREECYLQIKYEMLIIWVGHFFEFFMMRVLVLVSLFFETGSHL